MTQHADAGDDGGDRGRGLDPTDPVAFRTALGNFASGVTAVCALDGAGRPIGLTVSSFASASLDPPLVSFCVNRGSWTWTQVRSSRRFAVSVLSEAHGSICRQLARPGDDRFAGVAWSPAPSGAPVVDDALAWFDCTIAGEHEAGDHDLVVAEVRAMDVATRPGDPLIFFRSQLRGL
ncbi:flavin reductase family protein [Actinomarinicola tropica]|uniref:Flavin reductase n=1 Tax=Actinomarinicola tropica TaxID=2789776 RepID=A0A5Q2RGP6_9ACTN|nr:flavin reductase family protein [Actinomarinicola tropica]QGG95988.1 flavin reductase [Actinomarinicola tropica]